MAKKIIAYRNSKEQFDDEISSAIWGFFLSNGWRALLGFILVSTPVFLGGVLTAPTGTPRVDHGYQLVERQHEFLWTHATNAVKSVSIAVSSTFESFNENGSNK